MEKIKYNGQEIGYSEDKEMWWVTLKGGTHYNVSLKRIKEYIDKAARNDFECVPVFVRVKHYYLGGGRDKAFVEPFEEATVTSISPNGDAFVVRKGRKAAEKYSIRHSPSGLYHDTPKNRKLIAEYTAAFKKEWEAEVEQDKLRKQLEEIDGEALYKKTYGRGIHDA